MNNTNIPAQNPEQNHTQTPNLDELNKAFAEVAFMWSCILTHNEDNTDTAYTRFKWLSERAIELAAVSMQIHTGGAK